MARDKIIMEVARDVNFILSLSFDLGFLSLTDDIIVTIIPRCHWNACLRTRQQSTPYRFCDEENLILFKEHRRYERWKFFTINVNATQIK